MNVIFLLSIVASGTGISLAIAGTPPTLPPPTNARVTTRDGPFPGESYVGKETMICSRLPGDHDLPVTLNRYRDVNVGGHETSAFKCVCDTRLSHAPDLGDAESAKLFARGNPLYVSPEEAHRREKKREDALTRHVKLAHEFLKDNLLIHGVTSEESESLSTSILTQNGHDMRRVLEGLYDEVLAEARREGH